MGNCFLYKRGGGFGGAIPDIVIKAALGKVIPLSDSIDAKLKGLRIFGKTTQNGTPTPDAPVELVSAGASGAIKTTVCGKNLASDVFEDYDTFTKSYASMLVNPNNKQITMRLTDKDTSVDVSGCSIGLCEDPEKVVDTGEFVWSMLNGGSPVIRTASYKHIFMHPKTKEGFEKIFARYNVQVEFGNTATEYEPFKPIQTITASTPNGLPGYPVSSGGNYTDENGQQWICDEVDFARGKYVQRVPYVENITFHLQPGFQVEDSEIFCHDIPGGSTENFYILSNMFPYDREVLGKNLTGAYEYHGKIYARIAGISDEATFNSKVEGVVFYYILDTPIEHDLSAEELAQYAALHTNYPNTTIYNDAGAGMEVKYTSIGG